MIKNIINQLLVRGRAFVILKKLLRRLFYAKYKSDLKWLITTSEDPNLYMQKNDNKLYDETNSISKLLSNKYQKKIETLDVKLGGAANCDLLYFLIRKLEPEIIFETGVAAGFSSATILTAIKKNKKGTLFSSDFPYFRIENPENYIGILVDSELQNNWKLEIEGDVVNIKKFLKQVEKIDLFHYDSDKSYNGKKLVFNLVKSKMKKGSVFIFDDIQDDRFFKDIVEEFNYDFKVFKFNNKYIGLIQF